MRATTATTTATAAKSARGGKRASADNAEEEENSLFGGKEFGEAFVLRVPLAKNVRTAPGRVRRGHVLLEIARFGLFWSVSSSAANTASS